LIFECNILQKLGVYNILFSKLSLLLCFIDILTDAAEQYKTGPFVIYGDSGILHVSLFVKTIYYSCSHYSPVRAKVNRQAIYCLFNNQTKTKSHRDE